MLVALFPAELDRLREIEAVRQHLLQRAQDTRSMSRRWLFAGLTMLTLGGGLVGLSQADRGGAVEQYAYQSTGVIRPGESLDAFAAVDDEPNPTSADYAARIARRDELIARVDEQTRSLTEFRGPTFIENLPEGKRVWSLVGATESRVARKYSWALAPGLALIIGGLGCFFISWRRP